MSVYQQEDDYEIFESRPELQRREIGPVFHDLAHKVYDQVEAKITDGTLELQSLEWPRTLHNLEDHLLPVVGLSVALAYEATGFDSNGNQVKTPDESPYQAYSAHLLERDIARLTADDILLNRYSPTTIQSAPLVKEAVSSGVVSPYRLFLAVRTAEQLDAHERDSSMRETVMTKMLVTTATPQEAAEVIESPVLDRMLHQLAYAPNGFLGRASTSFSHYDTFNCFQQTPVDEVFEFEEDKVVGFAQRFLDVKQSEIRRVNHRLKTPGFVGGGCPVRHAGFQSVGEAAHDYLRDVKGHINQGESAITRGARLVAFALRHIGNQEAA